MTINNSLDLVKGQWRLLTCITEKQASTDKYLSLGESPKGRLIITENAYLLVLITTSQRAIVSSDLDKVSAYDTMVSYSGHCELAGNKLTTKVDMSWNEKWVGGTEVRFFEFVGDTLVLTTAWEANPFEAGANVLVRSVLTWEREA